MLKLNTVLTAMAVVLLTLLSFLGARVWSDVADTKAAMIRLNDQMEQVNKITDDHSHRLDDHESRIRANENKITILEYRTGGPAKSQP